MDNCQACKDEELIENPDGEIICLECGWTSSGVGLSRMEATQAKFGYQEAS